MAHENRNQCLGKLVLQCFVPNGKQGQRAPGRVDKFKKAAGHMGPDPRCMNSKVFRIEATRNLIFLKGPLPGHKGSVVNLVS